MADEHKLSAIKVVFTNGGTEVFKNVEEVNSGERTLRLSISDHTYYTQIPLDKILYFEEVIDDNSVTYCAEGGKHD